MAELPYRGGGK